MIHIPLPGMNAWIDDLAAHRNLYAPVPTTQAAQYRRVNSSTEIRWSRDQIPQRSIIPVKDFIFPATERLLLIERNGDRVILEETLPETEQIIFGVRSCESRGLLALDAMFLHTPPIDPYFAARRANTTLVGFACPEMESTCFCTSTGGGPADPQGLDIMVYVMPDGYLLKVLTERGDRLIRQHPPGNPLQPQQTELPARYRQVFQPQYEIPQREFWTDHPISSYWDSLAERCLSCRLCAYICPTCRCFDLRDEPVPGGDGRSAYERLRCWDSCTGEGYRRIAGGHNSRTEKGQRLQNRLACKFLYYPEQYGPLGCTGCGRCIDLCPVNIDITEVLADIAEMSG